MLSTIAYGLTIGAILYLVSVGLSLTFGTMRIVNFAHGLIYTIGAYFLLTLLPFAGGHFFLCATAAVLLTIPISYAVERYVVRRLYGVSIDYAIIATYAVVLIGVDLIKWIWGATPKPLSDPIGTEISLLGVTLPTFRVVIIGLAIVLALALWLFFKYTVVGKIVVASLEDKDAVRGLGIDVERYFCYVFVLGSCLAALGGVLYAPITSVHPYMGFMTLLLSFAVVIVGGLGNLKGTFIASFALGMLMAVIGRYWGPASETAVFVVMVGALILKPIEV